MKFAALNKETSGERTARPEPQERRATREAQESGCLQRYHEAIRLQQGGETGKARALYCEILGSKVMEEAEGTMLRLKFLTFKNLGSIARGCGDDSAALDAFIQAVDVDGSDVTVWYQMALAATALGNLLLARTALDEARRCHAHYWPAIDLLCSLLLALSDDISCLQLISEVLPHLPDFPRGLAYLHHLADSSPQVLTFMPRLRLPNFSYQVLRVICTALSSCRLLVCRSLNIVAKHYLMKPRPPETDKLVEEAKQLTRRRGLLLEVKVLEEPIKPPKPLAYYSLHSLGQSLVSLYRHCISLSSPSLASPIDVQLLCEGTSERPLLPNLVNLAPPTSSEEVSGEESGEGERREAKRRNPDFPTPVLPKRRSSRVKSRREQVCASERFARFLPERLRGCEFGDVCALLPLPLSEEAPLPSFTDQSDCSVLDQPRLSSHVVKTFLQEHNKNSGVVNIIYNYLFLLAQHYNWHWSEASFSVVKVYMELYELVQSHLIFPSPLCSPGDPDYTSLQNTAMICQCYSELKLDHLQRCPSSPAPLPLPQALSFSQMSCSDNGWSGSREFLLRVRWCMFKRRQLDMDSRGALAVLRECHCLLEEKSCRVQVLPNLRQDPCISPVQVSRKIRALEQVLASQEVFGMFQSGDHSGVVSCLRPMLDWTSDNFSQFLLGGRDNEEQTPISMLLLSLLAMKRWQECLLCSVAGLQELLVSYKLGNERWVSALHTVYTHLDRCLEEADLLQECGESLQRHLVVCVFRTLELQVEMTDSPLFHLLPLSLPCSVLYFSLLSLWEGGDVAMETRSEPSVDVMETETEQLPVVAEETDREAILGASPAVTTNQERCRVSGSHWGLQFLWEVHDYLGGGGQGWCVGDKGRILHILVGRLREELRQLTAHPPKTREALLRELEQCYYCLYGHPHKKAKAWGLQDHGAEQMPLTWDSAQVLLEFYHPSFLPAVEENKALTPELVSLYRKVVDIIPDTGKVIPLSIIAGYIEGRLENLPLPSPPAPHTSLVSEIFYLLADDALKSSDFFSALHNYSQSVCYCPERVDTWAGLALARARTVMKKLDRRDVRGGMEAVLQKQVTPILRCFKRALALGSQHHYITEKYGLFCYTVQSYCSQIITMPHLYSGKVELMSWAERSRRGLLKLARQCFHSALSKVGGARAWLYGLVAAKAGVKLGHPPVETLPLLTSVAKQLSSGDVIPPASVELRGPWMTWIEVQYQIFSCALKYIMTREVETVGDRETAVANAMGDWQGLPLSRVEYPGVREWVLGVLRGGAPHSPRETPPQHAPPDTVSLLVGKVIADAEREVALETGKPVQPLRPEATPTSVLEMCVYGVAMVSIRCPAYYKSLYRLASVFHSLGHSQEARSLLLGPLPEPLLTAQDKLQPLFVLKSNIFANFWQIPVEEINRPGRFSSSARASLQLLCEVLSQQKDSSSLLVLVQYLRSRPDSSRQYLRDYERVAMCQKAIQYCTSVHQHILRDADSCSDERLRCLLLEIHSLRTYSLRTDSRLLSISKTVESCLVQCHRIYQTRLHDNRGGVASSVEEAIRCCQLILRQQTEKLVQLYNVSY